jgi:superfamily II DNA/RNA helicase
VNEIPNQRQTLMYTATWPKEVCKIAGNLLVDPVQVNNGNTDELAANKSITQQQFMGTSLQVNGTLSFSVSGRADSYSCCH